jgi:hypothetical protein
VERSSPPFLNSLQTVLGSLVIDLFLPQEHGQNVLIDRIICGQRTPELLDIPSTIKTLMGGTTESCPPFLAAAPFFAGVVDLASLMTGRVAGFDALAFGVVTGTTPGSLLPGPTILAGEGTWASELREVVVADRSRPMARIGSEVPGAGVGSVLLRDAARDNVGVSLVRRVESSLDC